MRAENYSGLFVFIQMIWQKEVVLNEYPRGMHLVSHMLERELPAMPVSGLLNIFIKHTSAAISLNENADPTVRTDLDNFFNRLVKEREAWYNHTFEGDDDMPAHIKSTLIGNSLTIPVTNSRMNLGIWQGIYLCEFRDFGGPRKIVLTLIS